MCTEVVATTIPAPMKASSTSSFSSTFIPTRRPPRRRFWTQIGQVLVLQLALVTALAAPPARFGHVAILGGNTLYVHGGRTGVNPLTSPVGSDLIALDISQPFNAFSIPWTSLAAGPYAAFHAAGLTGPSNNLLAVYGGNTSMATVPSGASMSLYNFANATWSSSPLPDPPRREYHTISSRLGDGTLVVFGGMVLSSDLSTETSTSELWTLGGYLTTTNGTGTGNSTNGSSDSGGANSTTLPASPSGLTPWTAGWQLAAGTGAAPTDRSGHTATMMRANGLMVVIGGNSGGALVPMTDVRVYDAKAKTWSAQTATGATPPSRQHHVAAATADGKIYVHGGTDTGGTVFMADISILDTTTWTWSQPGFQGTAPTGRYAHSATSVGTNILFAFGLTAGGADDAVQILDTTSLTWTSAYTPNNLAQTSTVPQDWPGYVPPPASVPTDSPLPTPGGSSGGSKGSSVAPVLGGVFGFIAVAAAVFAGYRYHRQKYGSGKNSPYYGNRGYGQPYMVHANMSNRPFSALEHDPYGAESRHASEPSVLDKAKNVWIVMTNRRFWKDGWDSGFKGLSIRNGHYNFNSSGRSGLERLTDDDPLSTEASMGPPSDQELFLAAVQRARSRAGVVSPDFAPLQQPLSPTTPISPRFPPIVLPQPLTPAGGQPQPVSVAISPESGPVSYPLPPGHVRPQTAPVPPVATEGQYEDYEGDPFQQQHDRAYSDGFENVMLDMDVQMLAVPRGRLFVVNPSDGAHADPEREYNDFDSTRLPQ